MRILLINKFFFLKGGAERYLFNQSKLLENRGHQVAFFAMQHPQNRSSKWAKYFPRYVNLKHPRQTNTLKTIGRMFYSFEAQHKIQQLINDFKPDIAHIHNLYGQLSPSILPVLTSNHIPIVQTVHDYHLIHPNPTMYHDGHICTITNKSPWACLFHRCLNPALIYSLPPSLAFCLHKTFQLYERHVDTFISPSRYMFQMLRLYGFPKKKLYYLPNLLTVTPIRTYKPEPNPPVLYAGQLVTHKGVRRILQAARHLPHIPFILIGQGELTDEINGARLPNLHLLPHSNTTTVFKHISQAAFTLCPSLWNENQPYAILESFLMGKPVIATNIGGIPEIVKHRQNGLLIPNNDDNALIQTINYLYHQPELIKKLGARAAVDSKKFQDEDTHYQQLLSVYNQVIS
jgi:glycosyltransferase involved in cell wall biosynthesis